MGQGGIVEKLPKRINAFNLFKLLAGIEHVVCFQSNPLMNL